MVWASFAGTGPQILVAIEFALKSCVYQSTRVIVGSLNIAATWHKPLNKTPLTVRDVIKTSHANNLIEIMRLKKIV